MFRESEGISVRKTSSLPALSILSITFILCCASLIGTDGVAIRLDRSLRKHRERNALEISDVELSRLAELVEAGA